MTYRTFPVLATKKPACRWSDETTWRQGTPDGAQWYAIPTGRVNGIWVLDIDNKPDKNGAASLHAAGHALPDTYTVRTQSGGYHLYFRWDDDHPVYSATNILPGVDVRGDGGYVVGPGSGGVYNVKDERPVARAPDWLLDLVKARPKIAAIEVTPIGPEDPRWSERLAMATEYLEKVPPCVSGNGGQAQLWLVALQLARTFELPVAECVRLATPYSERCQPPWAFGDLERVFTRAQKEGHTIPGTFASNFLLASEKVPRGPPEKVDRSWYRVKDPEWNYGFDISVDILGGSEKETNLNQRYIASTFTGPGASDAWRGVWQYDSFRNRVVAVNPPMRLNAEDKGLDSTDLANIRIWMSWTGIKATTEQIAEALRVAASAASFHPIRDYLDGLPEMTKEDAEAYFTGLAGRLWGATERNEIESGYLKHFAIAAVRRVRVPGTQVDTMLILGGEQGWNKSRFCAALFGKEFFRSQFPSLENKDEASIAIQGYWCVEMSEMQTMSSAREATKKEFLSRTHDEYRPKYERGTVVHPRQCVFMGTTNEDDHLTDPTGARRYRVCEVTRPIDLGALDRDTFWAAAARLESEKVPHWIEPEGEQAREEAARFGHDDSWTDIVLRFVKTRADVGYTTVAECLNAIPVPADRQDDRVQNRMKAILRRHLGPAKPTWVNGRTQRVYRVKSIP